MSNSFFSFKQFTIHQDKVTMMVTTDACILGAYACFPHPKKMLDIGTGTGLLSIMMAQRYESAEVDGIESDQMSADQATLNAKYCPWHDRIRIHHIRIQDYVKQINNEYDLIICNPPYFESQLKSFSQRKNIARHGTDLHFSELAFIINKIIKKEGNFYTIAPYDAFHKLNTELSFFDLILFDYLEIYNVPKKPLNRIIGGFSKIPRKKTENKLLIMNEKREYTAFFKTLLKDYYLAF